jgi:hypothetical protein
MKIEGLEELNPVSLPTRSTLVDVLSDAPVPRPGEDPERDRVAIRAVARGSGDAVAELYDRYGATVYGLALRVLGQPDLAEEVVQDVFAQVWRELLPLRCVDRLSPTGW